jgi:DNA repair protein RadC
MADYAIDSPQAAIRVVGDMLKNMDREHICTINLQSNGLPINCSICSIGTINYAVNNPADMLKSSILSNAASLIMVHNHTSGELKPSKEDITMTDRMIKVCNMVGIPLIDHVIVGGDNAAYYSIREKNLLFFDQPQKYERDINKLEFSKVAERGKTEHEQIYIR